MSHFSIDRQPVINRGCSRCRASRVLDSAFFVPVVCVAFENDVMAIFGDADCASATSMTRSADSIFSFTLDGSARGLISVLFVIPRRPTLS
jgi:hypothetical protein